MTVQEIYNIFLRHSVVTTDSRDCPEGSVFVALKGATFNGNAFAVKALEQGCAYAVVDEDITVGDARAGLSSRLIRVDDSLVTLQALAREHRRRLGTPVIGVTGTNGKTTTKELIAAVLGKKYNVLYTQGNLNNHIGVPKTLLRLTKEHDIAVVEMGANHPGEIRALVNIAEPDMGIITNVGRAHLEGFGSFEGVKRTKGELYDYLAAHGDGGVVFINADDADLKQMADERGLVRRVSYGTHRHPGMSVRGEAVCCNPFLNLRWEKTEGCPSQALSERPLLSTHLIGSYNIYNMLAAAAIGDYLGVAEADISDALAGYVPSNNRSQMTVTESNRLIVDAYNANPTSMNAALVNFRDIEAGRKMVILGEMGELGADTDDEHVKVMRFLREAAIPEIWLVGKAFRRAGDVVPVAGAVYFDSVEDVKKRIEADKPQQRTILIKGSNAMRLFQLPPLL